MSPLGAARMTTRIGPVELPTPVLVAAGAAGPGLELRAWGDVAGLGALTSPTLRADAGPVHPAGVVDTPRGLVWPRQGGRDVGTWCDLALPRWAASGARVVLAVAGGSVAALASAARHALSAGGAERVVGLELQLTDPDAEEPSRRLVDEPAVAARAVSQVRDLVPPDRFVIVRLEDERQELVSLARQLARAGADGFLVSGTPAALLPGAHGLLLGPSALGTTAQRTALLSAAVRAGDLPPVPLLATGGIRDAEDAAHLVSCGACAVETGSVLLLDPTRAWEIVQDLPPRIRGGTRRTGNAAAGHLPPTSPGARPDAPPQEER